MPQTTVADETHNRETLRALARSVDALPERCRLVYTTSGSSANVAKGRTTQSFASAPSLSTVFQFRPVPCVPSFFSMREFVRRERPIPAG